jgi:drug/metabolite transporter (DMT)-like permease
VSSIPWYVWVFFAALTVAISSAIEKRVLTKEHAVRFTASLSIMSALVSLPMLFFVEWSDITPMIALWLYGASFVGSVAFLFVVRAMRHIELGEVSIFLLASPATVAVLSYLFLDELLSQKEVAGLLLALLGVLILEWPSIRLSLKVSFVPGKARYVLFAVGAVVLYSIGALFDRHILSQFPVNAVEYVAITQCCIALNMVLFSRFHYGGFGQMWEGVRAHWKELGTVALLLSVSRVFYSQAVALTLVALVAVVKRSIAALLTNIFSHFFFGEDHFGRKMIAMAVVVAGILLVVPVWA